MTLFRMLIFSVIVALSANLVAAQKPTSTPERNREIVALLNDARLASPELTVDTFLKVVESKKITEPAWRREILEEALRTADEVKYPVRMSVVYFPNSAVDTRAGYMSYAYDQQLDALSLKARILKLMIPVETFRAKQIIYQMAGNLGLKRLTCEDTMVYDVTEIYSAIAAVAKAGFTQKEATEGVRALFVLPWIENIESPAQIGPAMNLVGEILASSAEGQLLFSAFGRTIGRNFNDDRSFSQAMGRDRLLSNFAALSRKRSLSENMNLGAEFREFILKNTTAVRCLDNKPLKKDELPAIIKDANYFYDTKPFVLQDFESVEYKGSAKVVDYWKSETYVNFLNKYRTAREKKNDPEKKEDKAAQLEWELKVSELLNDLEKWEPKVNESEADVFALKCVFYDAISREVPDGPLRATVVRAFLRFLTNSPLQKSSFIEWLYHAKGFAEKYPVVFKETARDFPNANLDILFRRGKAGI